MLSPYASVCWTALPSPTTIFGAKAKGYIREFQYQTAPPMARTMATETGAGAALEAGAGFLVQPAKAQIPLAPKTASATVKRLLITEITW